jgi:hypothetical protein
MLSTHFPALHGFIIKHRNSFTFITTQTISQFMKRSVIKKDDSLLEDSGQELFYSTSKLQPTRERKKSIKRVVNIEGI